MPSVSGKHDGRKVLLPVAILRSDNPMDVTHVRGLALLDTGATTSAISLSIIDQLGLVAYEKRPLMVATEERLVDYFLFRIGLVPQSNSENGLPFVFAETDGFRIRSSMGFDVILGMDVLRQCDFGMRRTGDWQLSFG